MFTCYHRVDFQKHRRIFSPAITDGDFSGEIRVDFAVDIIGLVDQINYGFLHKSMDEA